MKKLFVVLTRNSDYVVQCVESLVQYHPGVYCKRGITVLTEREQRFDKEVYGICTDYPLDFI